MSQDPFILFLDVCTQGAFSLLIPCYFNLAHHFDILLLGPWKISEKMLKQEEEIILNFIILSLRFRRKGGISF